ncbi:ABC transporter transmembrane domain-containing protein, partial [Vibrio splendidus]|uniref:ABC transporter transmembrane domain-containing protein n=1 Tax=Vibrio splendidus TaxID=29497 RepID=UPI001F53486A
VVLTGYKNGKYYINDPGLGQRVLDKLKFSDSFTGIVLELTPNSEFKKENSAVVMKIDQLWEKVSGLKRSLISLFALTITLQCVALLSPYYMQWVIDHVLLSNDEPLLTVLAIGFSLLCIIHVSISAFRSWLVIRLSSTLNIQMGANLFSHLLRLPISYFEKRHIGDVVSRFGSLGAIQGMMTTGFVEGVIDGLMTLVVLVMMYIYSPELSSV